MVNSSELIIQYRYLILIPLSLIEGPMVAFIAGTLASLGYFSLPILGVFFLLRDMGMDALYYFSGYFWGDTQFAKKMLKKLNINSNLSDMRTQWEKHPARTLMIGKLSYGIAGAFIVVAGIIKMRMLTFFKYGALIAILQYGTLLLLGYFFGNAFGGNIKRILENIIYVIAGITLFISAYYILSWYVRKKFMSK